MTNEIEYSLQKLKRAFLRLKESTQSAVDELDQDGVIQRFEFTFELFWKTTKIFLEHEGLRCASPRSCIKEGVRRDFLTGGETLLDMLEDRNKASHIYDESAAREIFERIKKEYVKLIEQNISLFEKYLANDER
jgi:nucleotidyltransferase substrate binding protein (TIGR01987 family)